MKLFLLGFVFFAPFLSMANDFKDIPTYNKPVLHAKEDLDHDGKLEDISLSMYDDNRRFILKIDKATIEGSFEYEEAEGFTIVDIDKKDKYKELAIHASGECNYAGFLILWYDGKSINRMNDELIYWPRFKETGNGILLSGTFMGFWVRRDKYVLNSMARTLDLIPQEFYYVGLDAKIDKSFPIYKTRNSLEIVANLKQGSKIQVLVWYYSDDNNYEFYWYLVKSETGIMGWTTAKLLYMTDMPWAC